jgi:hypothetical protein
MITKDPVLKPLHEHPYTPGEQFIIGEADPPGARISGVPPRPSQEQSQDTSVQEKADERP